MIPELKYSKNNNRILILGAFSQIGSVLTKELRKIHGSSNVIASDIREDSFNQLCSGPFEIIDAITLIQLLLHWRKFYKNYLFDGCCAKCKC